MLNFFKDYKIYVMINMYTLPVILTTLSVILSVSEESV